MTDYWSKTTEELQPLIGPKPALKENLLQKPPFRFIHDIVKAVIDKTGFLKGAFLPEDLDQERLTKKTEVESEKADQKTGKLRFLETLISSTQAASGRQLEAKATKIIAGEAAEDTNALLQALAEAIKKSQAGGGVDAPAAAAAVAEPVAVAAAPAPTPEPTPAPKPAAAASSAPAKSGGYSVPPAPATESFWEATVRTFSPLNIAKPALTERLLGKPPFAYILDLTIAVLDKTKYPEGYFSAEELNKETYKDPKDSSKKLVFLDKLITKVQETQKCEPALTAFVSSKKIASGTDAEQTNQLLRELALASMGLKSPTKAAAKAAPAEVKVEKEEAPKSMEAIEANVAKVSSSAAAADDDDMGGSAKLSRAKTARRAPPRLKTNFVNDEKAAQQTQESEAKAASGVIKEGTADEKEDEEPEEERKEETLPGFEAPPSREPADEPTGPQGKLVRQLMAAEKGADDGKLKSQITFKRLTTNKTNSSTVIAKQQLEDMRKGVQNVCHAAHPLGKCVDFVYEDMDLMDKELNKWKSLFDEYTNKLEKERRATAMLLDPLKQQLQIAEQSLQDQIKASMRMKAQILKNDAAIAKLLDSKSEI